MIIKIFKNVGKGSSKGPINYLLGKDKDGKERDPEPKVLNELVAGEGSKNAVAFLIDNNHRQNKYTSGVISFRDDEKPSGKEIQGILKDFRETFLPTLEEDRAPVLWVLHRDKGNVELHFLVAKQDAKNGRALNIAPPGAQAQRLLNDFQKVQNDKLGYKQVVPNLLSVQFDSFEKRTRKAKFSKYLTDKVKANEIQNRSDLLRHLQQDLKWKVSRIGQDYISVIPAGKDKPIRLKGPAFTAKADYREMLKQASDQPTKLTLTELEQVKTSLNKGIQARTDYNNKTFNRPPTNFKSKSLNLKGSKKMSVPKLPTKATAPPPKLEEFATVPASQTASNTVPASTHTNPPPSQKTQLNGSSGASSGGSGTAPSAGSSLAGLTSQFNSIIAMLDNEKDPIKRGSLMAQLVSVRIQKEQALQAKEKEEQRISIEYGRKLKNR